MPILRSPLRSPLYSPLVGKWGGIDPDAEALFARFTTPPTDARKILINNLIVTLKSPSVDAWSRLDMLWAVGANEQATQRNWIADQYNLAPQSAPTFLADRYYQGNGTSSYLDTSADRAALALYTQDSASFGCWETANVAGNTYSLGNAVAGVARITGRSGADQAISRINTGSSQVASVATSIGLTSADRTSGTANVLYKNGTALASVAIASTALSSGNFYFLRDGTVYAARSVAAGFFGASLGAARHLSVYNAFNAYLQAIGAA